LRKGERERIYYQKNRCKKKGGFFVGEEKRTHGGRERATFLALVAVGVFPERERMVGRRRVPDGGGKSATLIRRGGERQACAWEHRGPVQGREEGKKEGGRGWGGGTEKWFIGGVKSGSTEKKGGFGGKKGRGEGGGVE